MNTNTSNARTYQAGAMDAERRLEVGCLVEIVLKTLAKRVAVGPDEISLHLRLADHAIPNTHAIVHTDKKPSGPLEL